jgi:hypothetical protein
MKRMGKLRHSHKCHTIMSWVISGAKCTRRFNEDASSKFSNSAWDVLTTRIAAELNKDGYETIPVCIFANY